MRRRYLLLLAFLIFLYIGPVNLMPYDTTPSIVEQPQKPNDIHVLTGLYNVEIAASEDDTWWRWNGTHWEWNTPGSAVVDCHNATTFEYVGHFRFQLNILFNSTILSANFTAYEYRDDAATAGVEVKRLNETNVGPFDEDTEKPAYSNTTTANYTGWDGVAAEWRSVNVTDLVQEQVELSDWQSGYYMGFQFWNSYTGANWHRWEAYDNATSNNVAYLNISFSPPSGTPYGASWLSGWSYRQQHNISQTAGTGENYTVPMYVWNGLGSSWYDEGYTLTNAQDDFDDIRWTTNDGDTEIEYQLNRTWGEETTDYFANDSEDFASYPVNYPNSFFYGNRTYITRHGPQRDPFVTYYDHENSTWGGSYGFGDNSELHAGDDGHGAPCLFVDREGYIHVFYGAHNDVIKHSRSTNPEDLSSYVELADVDFGASGSTYPHLFYDSTNDVLHCYVRLTAGGGAGTYPLHYRNSTNRGVSWNSGQNIVEGDSYFPYTGAATMDPTNTSLHIGWNRYTSANTSYQNVYYIEFNFTTGTVYNASGYNLGITVEYGELNSSCLVYWSSQRNVWGPDVHIDENTYPYLMWTRGNNTGEGAATIQFTRWTGSAWASVDDVSTTYTWYGGNGFIVHDSTNVTAFLSESTGADKNMTKFTWNGSTWTREGAIYEGGTRYLCFSTVPMHYTDEAQITFSEYIPNDVNCKSFVYGAGGIIQRTWPKHALFYVRVPDNLSNGAATIYLYYGNNTVTTTSNATMTLDYGNDPDHDGWGAQEIAGTSPTNDQTPSCINLDDSTYMYSMYKEYILTANVSDADGFANIDYFEITLYDNARGTFYWTIRFDEDTTTFTEQADTNNIITLNTTGSSYTTSGNTLNITVYLTLHWNHTDLADTDMLQYVIDAESQSDTDWYEVDWDIESDVTTTFTLSDGSGTTDRGNINGIDTITASGTVTYQGSSLYPPSDTADVWVNCTDVAGQPWSDTTLVSGAWSVTVDSDDVVGLDTYWAYVVDEGDGMTGTHINATSATDTYIADQIIVQGWHTDDDPDLRIDVGSPLNVTVWLQYVYDSTNVTDGTVTVTKGSMSYVGAGNWSYIWTEVVVADHLLHDVQCSGNTHGITTEDQNGLWLVCIWDRILIDIQADNEYPANNQEVSFTLTLTYDYDDTECTTYTIQIARNGTDWYVFTYGNRSLFNDTNSDAVYLYNATSSGANVSETAHGLTVFITNTETVTWTSAGPTNNETPSGSNFDDTDNLYAWYREYIILTNHSDEDGFTDIQIVQFSLWDDTRTTEYFRLQFNEDTATFSKIYEDVTNMITLNITACSNSSSGIYLNITWHIWVYWNFTSSASDSDSRLYVNDTLGTTDIDWYETDWDPITTCSVSTSYLDDGIGTVDRGTYGLNDSIWANGTLSYLTGVGGGDNYPPANRIDLWINSSACSYSPWSVASYDDSTGAFSALVDSGDSPKTSPDTDLYQVTAVEEGGAFDSDNFVVGGTDDYKPDIIEVTAFTQSLGRIDVNTTASMAIELRYHYDSSYVTSGSFSCNGTSMSYNGVSLRWDLLPINESVVGINYSSVIGADANIGVNIVNMSGYYRFQIWDRLVINIQADDESPYNDQEVRFTLTVTYDYDNTACTTYTIQIDRNATHWYVFTYANRSLFDDTNSDVLYLYNASSTGAGVWDSTYGLSAFTTNVESVRWSGTGFPDWHVLPTARLQFVVDFSEWHINALLVLLGLIMIPASSMYLVRGGRKELSTDKLFYVLLIFFIGWALLIGGIMP